MWVPEGNNGHCAGAMRIASKGYVFIFGTSSLLHRLSFFVNLNTHYAGFTVLVTVLIKLMFLLIGYLKMSLQ